MMEAGFTGRIVIWFDSSFGDSSVDLTGAGSADDLPRSAVMGELR